MSGSAAVGVQRGQDWGDAGSLLPGTVLCHDDAQARSVVREAMLAGRLAPPLGLLGGDLWRTLGAPRGGRERLASGLGVQATVDVVEVDMDGRPDWFVAHLVARGRWWRGSWWRGRVVAAMNAQFLGPWRVAPRAHPGDGLVDLVDADPEPADRWRARRRLPHGTHVPHPDISVRRVDSVELDLGGSSAWLDGSPVGPVGHISLQVLCSSLTVVV